MAKMITDLNSLETPSGSNELMIWDSEEEITKKITLSTLTNAITHNQDIDSIIERIEQLRTKADQLEEILQQPVSNSNNSTQEP